MATRTSQGRGVPRVALQGAAGGIFFLTFFGAYWGFFSAVFLSGAFQIISFLLVGLVTLAFFGMGGMLLRGGACFAQRTVSRGCSHGEKQLEVVWPHLWS